MTHNKYKKFREGQAMLLMVIILSAAILGTTSIVALMTLYEVRHTTGILNSARALAAADSGIQCALMKNTKDAQPSTRNCGEKINLLCPLIIGNSPVVLSNGASFTVTDIVDITCKITGVVSTGVSHDVARSFATTF